MSSAALVPLAILTVGAPLGAIDVLYFHLWKFRLYDRPGSRAESVTHILRSLILGSVVVLLVSFEPHGAWFWVIAGLLALDFINDIADVLLEPASRRDLGGVPPMEYLIHIVGSTLAGAAGAAFLIAGWPLGSLPSALAPVGALPSWMIVNAWLLGGGALSLAALKTFLLVRSIVRAQSHRLVPSAA